MMAGLAARGVTALSGVLNSRLLVGERKPRYLCYKLRKILSDNVPESLAAIITRHDDVIVSLLVR